MRELRMFGFLFVLFAASPLAAQEPSDGLKLSEDELQQIWCSVLTVPQVRAAVEEGKAPRVLVNEEDHGTVRIPEEPCPEEPSLPRDAQQFRIIRPREALDLYGSKGRHGVVHVDVPVQPDRGDGRRPALLRPRKRDRAHERVLGLT